MKGPVWGIRRSKDGEIVELVELDAAGIHPWEGDYLQTVNGIPWARIKWDEIAVQRGHRIKIPGHSPD